MGRGKVPAFARGNGLTGNMHFDNQVEDARADE
jgi:hypothetical protein